MSKYFLSALIIFVLLFSSFAKTKTKKCPVRIPDSLVSLYVKSDLIVIGELKSEKTEKVLSEDNTYKNLLTKQTVQVSKTLKGIHSPTVAVYKNQYIYKNNENGSGEMLLDDEIETTSYQIGEKALFFLKTNDQKQLWATDYNGIKKLNDTDLGVYQKRIKELSFIIKNKKDQAEKLAEWLVKCAEETATQREGIYEINRSLNILNYEIEEAENEEDTEKEVEEIEELLTEKSFNNSSEIAKNLTDSQKERLISVYLKTINQEVSDLNKTDRSYVNWELIDLVQKLDKQRTIFYLYSQFQNLKSEKNATLYLMENIANMIDDQDLFEIQYKFEQTIGKNDKDLIDTQKLEESEQNKEKDSANKMNYGQYRLKLIEDFENCYSKLASNNFERIEEEQTNDGDKSYEEPSVNDNQR
jgi:hypothetical protein